MGKTHKQIVYSTEVFFPLTALLIWKEISFKFLVQEGLRWIVLEEGKISNTPYLSLQKAVEKLPRPSLTNSNYKKEEVDSVVCTWLNDWEEEVVKFTVKRE